MNPNDIIKKITQVIEDRLSAVKIQKDEQLRERLLSTIGVDIANSISPLIDAFTIQQEITREEIVKAIKDININVSVPDVNVPEVKIPDINLPEFPKIPEINTSGVEQAIREGFSGLDFPAPQVTVQPTKVTVPKPQVTVNMPEVKFPDQIDNDPLPKYDSGTVKHTLDPIGEIWTLFLGKNKVAKITMTYFDKDKTELSSFNIDRYEV